MVELIYVLYPYLFLLQLLLSYEEEGKRLFFIRKKKEFIKIIILCYQPSDYCHAYPKCMTIEIKSTTNTCSITKYYLNTITIKKRNSKNKMNKAVLVKARGALKRKGLLELGRKAQVRAWLK